MKNNVLENKEFKKLKNSIAIKVILKIVLYTLICILVLELTTEFLYNDDLANFVHGIDKEFYYWCVRNKTFVLIITYLIIFFLTSFLVIRNSNNNMVKIIIAMDEILKNPENEVHLPNSLITLENRLNNIRVDLIKNQSRAQEEAQKKNDLIMYMAHDLKTPLTSVIGYLTLLSEEKKISKELQNKYINISLNKSLRLEDLINQFFDITRYNLQDMIITKNELNLTFLIEQLVEEAYPMLQEKNLKCEIVKNKEILFEGDGDKLARAFENLLKNAINYSYKDTTIIIEILEVNEKIKIMFKNKGDKIPKYKLERIFEKFYRVDEARTSNTGGAGLGLAITKQIIELHNGKIYAQNDDEYIKFYIELDKKGTYE